jgi:isoquinoline 1-oxidoreductase subunit beta
MSRTPRLTGDGIDRRQFLKRSAAVGGGLMLSVVLPRFSAEAAESLPPRDPSAFIHIGADDRITIVTPAVEMGQGGHTAMCQLLMEELGGDWTRLAVEDAPADSVYNNPMINLQLTAGSFAVRGWYPELRRIGAAAREMLVHAAAERWGVSAGECSVEKSVITHRPSGRTLSFGAVADAAGKLPIPSAPPLKGPADFRVIGHSPRRLDVPAKVNGSARFGIDVDLPGLVYAAIRGAPTLTGKLKSFDDSAAKRQPGYLATVPLEDAVVVVATSYWRAKKALAAVTTEWDKGKLGGIDSPRVSELLRGGFAEAATVARNEGDVEAARATSAKTLEAVYEVPYLAHACMEPMNCTVRLGEAGAEVWCGTQAPQAAQAAAAAALGLPADKVKVHSMYLGGGFGRRGEADYVAQAAATAKAVGRPVKLVWSREEDLSHDYYRPAAAIRFRASIGADGALSSLESNVVSASAPGFSRPGPPFYTGSIVDTSYSYAIPNFRVTGLNKDLGVRFGFWRSVNDSHNPFMLEGFIDEIAHHLKRDPYAFRRSLLQHKEAARHLAVLDLLAEKSGWRTPKAGRFLGIAAFPSFGSVIGSVAEISMKGKEVILHRVVTVIDCGVAVHPDNIVAQMQGGLVYGLSAVLRGEITLADGAVREQNFTDYPILTLAEMPIVECHIVPSTAPPGGIGEPGTGPIAPALANAIYAATGTRIRTLPLSKLGYTFSVRRAHA